MVAACLDSTRNRGTVDPHHDRITFYGHAYATIDRQFEHIVKVHVMPGGTHVAQLSNGQKHPVSRLQSRALRERLLRL